MGKGTNFQFFIFYDWKIPSMLIGFGLFELFAHKEFHSRCVNCLAGSAFGVYLIHYHPAVKALLDGLSFARQAVPARASARGHDTMRAGHLRLLPGIGPRTPRPVRCDSRPQPRPPVRTGLEQSHGTLMRANSNQSAKVVFPRRKTTFANWTPPSFIINGQFIRKMAVFQLRRVSHSKRPNSSALPNLTPH